MANNLIKNETNVFYTVEISEGVAVRRAEYYGGEVKRVEITRDENEFEHFASKSYVLKVAEYVKGKLIKHTRTEVITEVTEELKLEGEK